MASKVFVMVAAVAMLMGCVCGQSTTINGMTYTLMAPMLFNTLATTTTGCPAGATFAGLSGDEITAATTLAGSITIWINAATQAGQVPVKAPGATTVSYVSNTALPSNQYICKAPAGPSPSYGGPTPTPAPVYGGASYVLYTNATSIQDAYAGCRAAGGVLAGWTSAADRNAVQGYLSTIYPQIFTGEPTMGGLCQLASSTGLVMGSCLQALPYVCALPAGSPGTYGGTPATNMPSGYQLISTSVNTFQGCFAMCTGLGLRFVSYQNPVATKPNDVAAVNAALSSVASVYVNDYTLAGQCPYVSTPGAVTRGSCTQNLPFLCGPV